MIYDLCLPGSECALPKAEFRPRLTVDRIQHEVACHYGVSEEQIRSRSRAKLIARVRHVAMYLARELTDQSFPEIGRRFNKDYSTVIYGVTETEKRLKHDPRLAEDCAALRERLAA